MPKVERFLGRINQRPLSHNAQKIIVNILSRYLGPTICNLFFNVYPLDYRACTLGGDRDPS